MYMRKKATCSSKISPHQICDARLLTFPNVVITGHQAFFTRNALESIAHTTLSNLTDLETGGECANRVLAANGST